MDTLLDAAREFKRTLEGKLQEAQYAATRAINNQSYLVACDEFRAAIEAATKLADLKYVIADAEEKGQL